MAGSSSGTIKLWDLEQAKGATAIVHNPAQLSSISSSDVIYSIQ